MPRIISEHQHIYDSTGKMICCSLEDKIYMHANASDLLVSDNVNQSASTSAAVVHDDDDGHNHNETIISAWQVYLPATISFSFLIIGLLMDHILKPSFFIGYTRIIWYVLAYIPVGLPVMKEAWEAMRKGEYFTEFTLMSLATLGAFAIGEYPEGVAVMLFYAIGELFQSAAVNKAKRNIKALLDVRPAIATVFRKNEYLQIDPSKVEIYEIIQIKAGEKAALDGILLSDSSSFNTAALTGESKPKSIYKGETVLAGMLNLDKVIEIKVSKLFADSSLSRILEMVQHASSRKAKTELLIRRFAKIYTPFVFILALALIIIPYFILDQYIFADWLYRALVFLVISCPCALVISIPLGYFGGIGAASRNGILFKGSNYLDLMTKINTVILDKTGTMTKGSFKVQKIVTVALEEIEFIKYLASLEIKSSHPVARAITEYAKSESNVYQATDIEEVSGHGLIGNVNGHKVLAGNTKLFKKQNIDYDLAINDILETTILVAINDNYAGHVIIADEIKDDAQTAINDMKQNGISTIVMLSGDNHAITKKVGNILGIESVFGDLLPEDKARKVEELKKDGSKAIAFVGDGINDAPVLALSDIGIAMGAMGSDVAIETADVVIQTDQPSKIATAIKISKATKSIIVQNIIIAFVVKLIVLVLGAGGLATMWEAVFADVGVALLAILNAARIQKMKFD